MELKTIKLFAHKGNLGSGLTYENGVFKATVNLNGYLHKNNLGEGLVFSNNKVNVDLDDEFNTIATSLNQLNTKVTLINEQLGTVYKVEGSTTVDNINSMTVGNAMIGYVYNLLDSGVITNGLTGEIPVEAGDNVVYTENGWDKLSAAIKIALEAGDNIAIEGNKINALGYWHDKTRDAIKTNLNYNIATGLYSLAQNEGTQATGKSSHAEGGLTIAEGDYSHSEGSNTFALGAYSHAEGEYSEALGSCSHAQGNGTLAVGSNSHSEGYKTVAIGTCSHAEGSSEETEVTGLTWDTGSVSVLMTDTSIRIYPDSILCFYADSKDYRRVVSVSGLLLTLDSPLPYSSQDVWYTGIISGVAYGNYSHNEGLSTKSLGLASHAEGIKTDALGNASHTEGDSTVASGFASHTEGKNTTASGKAAHSEGGYTEATGNYSHAEGYGTSTTNEYEHAEGYYNKSNIGTIHSIGIGTTSSNRKNAFEVMQNGDAYLAGVGDYNGDNIESAKTLQEVISDLESVEPVTYTAGNNISIENGTISTLGYEFDNELNSVKVGRKLTAEELEEIFGESAATLAVGNTSTLTAWENGTFSWVKDTNIVQVTDTSLSLPGVIFKVTTNDDSILCCIVDRDLSNSQLIVDKDIPFDYIENVSTIDTVIGIAYGKASIAGQATSASGNMAHSEGFDTFAHGMSSHSEGIMNWALGAGSHVEGIGSVAYELGSHAEGMITKAYGVGSHTEGILTIATHDAEHAEGTFNVSNTTDWIGDTIHSVGIGTSHEDRKNALEVTTQGAVYMKDVGGYDGTTLAECYPVLLVINALLDSKNNDIPAINKRIDNLNIPTLPENIVNTVNGQTGDVTIDTSGFATTEEVQAVNTRIDELNIPSDLSNVVTKTDNYQVTLGTDNNPTHEKTLLVGTGLTTSNNESLVVGAYNNSEYFASWGVDAPAIQVGAGTEDSKRTVMVVQKNGKSLGLLGFEQNGFGDFAEYFEWADGNPEGEDRVGYMVLLNEDKIEFAESLDNCIGIITGTGAFVADSACLDWHGRYLKDKWGRNIYELTGVLAENPDYDPTKEYIPREYRKEWSPVGLVGKVHVRQDGTLKPNGFVGCVNGIATNVDKSSWRVLKVINEEIALILIR